MIVPSEEVFRLSPENEGSTTSGGRYAEIDGTIAVITGGNSGIGLATAKVFVKEGPRVTSTGRAAGTRCRSRPYGRVPRRKATLQDGRSRPHSKTRSAVKWDVFTRFANAGWLIPNPLGSLPEEHIEYQLDVNVKGVIWTVQTGLCLVWGRAASINLGAIDRRLQKAGPIGGLTAASKAAVRTSPGHGSRI